ncbi:MAG: sialidase family protein [Bacteroidetes bacterium]|nr:sialidase family protein [Bacteroidota bacterium]
MRKHLVILKYILVFNCCLCLVDSTVYAQRVDTLALEQRLAGKTKYADIMQEVDRYYQEKDFMHHPDLYREYKKWNRWAWMAARHVNANGEVESNTSAYIDEAQRMQQRAAAPSVSASTAGNWGPVGPSTTSWGLNRGSRGIGRIDRLVISPFNTQIMLAGSPAGGIWRTNDGGNNWFSISPYLPNCGVEGIVIDNNDPSGNTIYILTGDLFGLYFLSNYNFNPNSAGVLKTTDGGTTWTKLGNSQTVLAGSTPFKLIQLRNFPNVLMAATSNGLYASYDFGSSWARPSGVGILAAYDIEQHPTNDAVIYYSTQIGVCKSSDYGVSFSFSSTYTPVIDFSSRSLLSVSAAAPNEVFYLQCGASVNRIYFSSNSGNDFTQINSQNLIVSAPTYNFAFAVSPVNTNNMAAAGLSLSSSTNKGSNFGNMTLGNVNNFPVPTNYLHADIHDLIYTPNGALLYAATDGGVAVSSDNGVTWTDRSNGLQCSQYYKMNGFEGTENLYIGGLQDNGTHYTTNGNQMTYAGSGDGYACDFNKTNNDIFYLVENTEITWYRRSTNTLSQVSGNIPAANHTFYPDIICHPTNGNIVYAAYANTVWRTDNQGTSWTQIGTFSNNNGSSPASASRTYNGGLAVSPATPDRIYAASANTVRKSDDKGANWSTISGTTGWPANIGTITDIATRRNNADEIWITSTGINGANRITYSSNAGASWVDFTGTLPNVPVYSIFYTTDGDTYVGTELGVYFMDFAMSDWLPFYNGLPMIPVTDIFVNEGTQSITAATMGRGLWRSDLYSDCSPFLFLSSNAQGRNSFQTAGILQSLQQMSGSYGNELRYRSPVKISLKPGFKASAGSYFHGVIGPCGQGVFNRTTTTTPLTKAAQLQLNTN